MIFNILQAEYSELLWLELQAWYSGKSIEEEDIILENKRYHVDQIINEVINFSLSPADLSMSRRNSDNSGLESGRSSVRGSLENISEETSTPRASLVDPTFLEQVKSMDITCPVVNKPDTSLSGCPPVILRLLSGDYHQNQISMAMEYVIELIQQIESIEKLYPSTAALARRHFNYKSPLFERKKQAAVLWLNTSKDLFHNLHLLADFLELDTTEIWCDWLEIGLSKFLFNHFV